MRKEGTGPLTGMLKPRTPSQHGLSPNPRVIMPYPQIKEPMLFQRNKTWHGNKSGFGFGFVFSLLRTEITAGITKACVL